MIDTKKIAEIFDCSEPEITNIEIINKGMTNNSITFSIKDNKYFMRIPGVGTEKLIDREKEHAVYKTIEPHNLADEMICFDSDNGYKVTIFCENARVCNPNNNKDVERCIKYLKKFHELELKVEHFFDVFERIEYYESLWGSKESLNNDYFETKNNVLKLREFIDSSIKKCVLTHCDSVADNFLMSADGSVKLIDWEYAGMQDPHLDIAMFVIYACYEKEQIDQVIDIYFENECPHNIRMKIYAYISICGLMWNNWCEYKHKLGVDCEEYRAKQYTYAKNYYKIFSNEYEKV